LTAENRLFRPMLYLSRYFEQQRKTYYDRLFAVSANGAWEQWFHFFLEGVRSQAADAEARIHLTALLRGFGSGALAWRDLSGTAPSPNHTVRAAN
jgi:Fic family protein